MGAIKSRATIPMAVFEYPSLSILEQTGSIITRRTRVDVKYCVERTKQAEMSMIDMKVFYERLRGSCRRISAAWMKKMPDAATFISMEVGTQKERCCVMDTRVKAGEPGRAIDFFASSGVAAVIFHKGYLENGKLFFNGEEIPAEVTEWYRNL